MPCVSELVKIASTPLGHCVAKVVPTFVSTEPVSVGCWRSVPAVRQDGSHSIVTLPTALIHEKFECERNDLRTSPSSKTIAALPAPALMTTVFCADPP